MKWDGIILDCPQAQSDFHINNAGDFIFDYGCYRWRYNSDGELCAFIKFKKDDCVEVEFIVKVEQ